MQALSSCRHGLDATINPICPLRTSLRSVVVATYLVEKVERHNH
jgi:hypothetical protein